jgi:hypothetical protein
VWQQTLHQKGLSTVWRLGKLEVSLSFSFFFSLSLSLSFSLSLSLSLWKKVLMFLIGFHFGQIEQTLRSVCEAVLTDKTVNLTIRERRAKGLLKLGEMYERAGKKALSEMKKKGPSNVNITNNNNNNNDNNNNNTKNTFFEVLHSTFDLD